jgi:hypothetical protein
MWCGGSALSMLLETPLKDMPAGLLLKVIALQG